MNDLNDIAAMELEGGAQGGMTRDQVGECLSKCVGVEITAQSPEGGEVIGGEVRLELMEEPQARLSVGGREDLAALWPVARERLGGGDGDFMGIISCTGGSQQMSEGCNGRILEE